MEKIKFYLVWLVVMFSFVGTAYGESDYVSKFCKAMDGEAHYEMADGSKADCMTEFFVFKFTTPLRWSDCLGRALHYSAVSGKRGACVMTISNRDQVKYAAMLKYTIEQHNLPIDAVFLKKEVDSGEKRFSM